MVKKQHVRDDKTKRNLIEELSQKGHPLLFFYDELPSDYLKGDIKVDAAGKYRYIVNPPYSYDVLERWLYLGNWQAVYPPKTEFIGVDTFRKSVQDVEKQMHQYGVLILIDSFHDDIDWNVFSPDAGNATQL